MWATTSTASVTAANRCISSAVSIPNAETRSGSRALSTSVTTRSEKASSPVTMEYQAAKVVAVSNDLHARASGTPMTAR